MNNDVFSNEAVYENSFNSVPSETIIKQVNPGKKAIKKIIVGLVFSIVTWNVFPINLILPAVGLILSFLGYRVLKNENRFFKASYILTLVKMPIFMLVVGINSSIFSAISNLDLPLYLTSIFLIIVNFLLMLFLWLGIAEIQKKIGITPKKKYGLFIVLWYAVLCVLAFLNYNGFVLGYLLIIGYITIFILLYKLYVSLEKEGYAVSPHSKFKLSPRAVVLTYTVILLSVIAVGTTVFSSYPMKWTAVSEENTITDEGIEKIKNRLIASGYPEEALNDLTDSMILALNDTMEAENEENNPTDEETEKVKNHLLALGFPKEVLNDLTDSEILSLKGAVKVVSEVEDCPMNKGEEVVVTKKNSLGTYTYRKTVYDVKELTLTNVIVQLPGDRFTARIFHHFKWKQNPKYYGTEALRLWPASHIDEGYAMTDEMTGRLLCDHGGKVYTADFYSLQNESYEQESIFGIRENNEYLAEFSLNKKGANHRGYITYEIKSNKEGYIIDSWICYNRNNYPCFFPFKTAKDNLKEAMANNKFPFRYTDSALQLGYDLT